MKPRVLNIQPIRSVEDANAFLFGLVFNQNQKAERAWNAPHVLKERVGTLKPKEMLALPHSRLQKAFEQRPALHPFVMRTARHIHGVCQLLVDQYKGDARNVWGGNRTVNEVLWDLQKFPGIGKHKAIVGVFLLRRHLNVPIRDDGTRLNIRTTCPSLCAIYGDDE